MFLEFAPNEKKIALCPSFGVETIKKFNVRAFEKSIKKFKKLSVREESGQKIIAELTGRQVPILSDPVMLLDVNEWHEFAMNSTIKHRNYVLYIFLICQVKVQFVPFIELLRIEILILYALPITTVLTIC